MYRTLLVAGCCLLQAFVAGTATAAEPTLSELARQAVSADVDVAQQAITRLRAAGPAGLNALLSEHSVAINAHHFAAAIGFPGDAKGWPRLSHALNTVAGQHDAHATKLYWHTSLDEAKAAAKASGRPILSLRLLGRLDEECSCANSRFFRTVLYANADISKALREQFVLHWQSVRPVPKVTIDFGDGRKLVRSLTGNSIHYVLDANGHPVDALPGLYGPKAFRERLEAARQVAQSLAVVGRVERVQQLRAYHANEYSRILKQWREDLNKCGVVLPVPMAARLNQPVAGQPRSMQLPSARAAAAAAITKSVVEMPLLDLYTAREMAKADLQADPQALELATTDVVWKKIAALHGEDAKLDAASVTLIGEHHPSAMRAALLTQGKGQVEKPMLRMITRFQESIALDTVRNEYLLHRRLHQWFMFGSAETRDVDELNKRVYADLFLTPASDPWLGLVSDDVYTGLKDHGIVPTAASK